MLSENAFGRSLKLMLKAYPIRTIAKVTGLSSSRIHQLLHTDEADQIPDWLNDLSASLSEIEFESEDRQKLELSELQQELASEGEVLSIISWCLYSRRIILVGEGFFNVNFFLSDYPKGLAESSTCYAIASRCA